MHSALQQFKPDEVDYRLATTFLIKIHIYDIRINILFYPQHGNNYKFIKTSFLSWELAISETMPDNDDRL